MEPTFSRPIFEISSYIKFHENAPVGAQFFHADGQSWRS